MATKNVIVPDAVGVDIGCGMCAVKTNVTEIKRIKDIMEEIRKVIPVGFNKHKEKQNLMLLPKQGWLEKKIVSQQWENALKQIGTLGGGNHFIEIQKGDDDFIWLMIHSGSRNLGKKVADHYNRIAKELNEKWFSWIPKEWDLAFLPIGTKEGKSYFDEMRYCVDFALANRKLMMSRVQEILNISFNRRIHFGEMINIAHNYAAFENHFGQNVIVHRKGATSAKEGQIGIIPGSQGTSSYIVRGLGNAESFKSCSHGAGRKMGRKQAIRELNLEEEKEKLDSQGIIHGIRTEKDLDEAAGAYKDINIVMKNQSNLVEIVTELKPLAVIKG